PQVITDRDRNADRREEGDGLHPKQDSRPDPTTEESHEHVPRHHEEGDPGHRPDRVAAVGRPPFKGLEDRHRGQRHEDRPPSPRREPANKLATKTVSMFANACITYVPRMAMRMRKTPRIRVRASPRPSSTFARQVRILSLLRSGSKRSTGPCRRHGGFGGPPRRSHIFRRPNTANIARRLRSR